MCKGQQETSDNEWDVVSRKADILRGAEEEEREEEREDKEVEVSQKSHFSHAPLFVSFKSQV